MPLQIDIPGGELYDEVKNEFIILKPQTLHLEHSLISISKWEQKWHKPFISTQEKTDEETLDYIRFMTLDSHIDPFVYYRLTVQDFKKIDEYIKDPMTATTIGKGKNAKSNNRIITNEVIYYWMCELNIPAEYAKWHLNRLLTLIEVASIEKAPPKKMTPKEAMARVRNVNAERRAKYKAQKGLTND